MEDYWRDTVESLWLKTLDGLVWHHGALTIRVRTTPTGSGQRVIPARAGDSWRVPSRDGWRGVSKV